MSETFDTLGATRHLKAAGVAQPHAEAVADVVRDSRDGLATQAAMEAGMEALRREMKTGMGALSSRIDTLTWMIGLLFVMNMAIFGVMLARTF